MAEHLTKAPSGWLKVATLAADLGRDPRVVRDYAQRVAARNGWEQDIAPVRPAGHGGAPAWHVSPTLADHLREHYRSPDPTPTPAPPETMETVRTLAALEVRLEYLTRDLAIALAERDTLASQVQVLKEQQERDRRSLGELERAVSQTRETLSSTIGEVWAWWSRVVALPWYRRRSLPEPPIPRLALDRLSRKGDGT